jgi:hypothetical protein
MPNINNPVLSLQHGGTGASRTARVAFTPSFSSLEILASEVFKADISIQSNDGDRTLSVGTAYMHASPTPAAVSVSRTFTRLNLDEDPDVIIPHVGDPIFQENEDEWRAVITVSPMVFSTVTARSEIVTGSWGPLGHD